MVIVIVLGNCIHPPTSPQRACFLLLFCLLKCRAIIKGQWHNCLLMTYILSFDITMVNVPQSSCSIRWCWKADTTTVKAHSVHAVTHRLALTCDKILGVSTECTIPHPFLTVYRQCSTKRKVSCVPDLHWLVSTCCGQKTKENKSLKFLYLNETNTPRIWTELALECISWVCCDFCFGFETYAVISSTTKQWPHKTVTLRKRFMIEPFCWQENYSQYCYMLPCSWHLHQC